MRVLTPGEIIRVWERGEKRHPLDAILDLLGRLFPERDPATLAALPLGRRDAILLRLRSAMFGDLIPVYCECPDCRAALEMNLSVRELLKAGARGAGSEDILSNHPAPDAVHGGAWFEDILSNQKYDFTVDDLAVTVRPPSSVDLGVVILSAPERAHAILFERCVLSLRRAGAPVGLDELSLETRNRIAEGLGECDPLAEISLVQWCPDCEKNFRTYFDIARHLQAELAREARGLLHEVHRLARHYGWREGEILALSRARRRNYLKLIEA